MNLKVDLRAAKIPYLGLIAVHYWFVIHEKSYSERWEIWQSKDLVMSSWGHLHQNLMTITQGVGNGHSWRETQWQGKEAEILTKIIRESSSQYPYNYVYRYYPGPNSNTYAQWILDEANIPYGLERRGLGKNYLKYAHFLVNLKNKVRF
ncbi:MAG: DUF3750 domain-containing protein [Cyanobacteria bacterium]|nr:DUF3750 domain-containing protein [Cyanobacteria bacterium CG_2015-16_32_12]NCO79284.1 DUF3750 domain-containing protein [Cyanobacteria bacterium CG_2015-22_32_23]NCQ41648.1 DUF3750 domain-containing protein [Cyanobacteria bacterium CG_2015-04_32_10]NCS85597.1 DUF3750 domain-containing protein [Cyanobacteria bacterium CG_2015-02_32_10]